ncbi:MAG: hypothetical protein R2864_07420 [Syntrophotaleaceae bacterium]
MHSGLQELSGLYYGYDEDCFYLRLDFGSWRQELAAEDAALELRFTGQNPQRLRFVPADGRLTMTNPSGKGTSTARAAYRSIFELALPLKALGLAPQDHFAVSCHLYRSGREIGRWPGHGEIRLCYRGIELASQYWFV